MLADAHLLGYSGRNKRPTPAPLTAALCRCGRVLRGDERVAVVSETRAFLSFGADFQQLFRGFLDAPAALRGHHAPEKSVMPQSGPLHSMLGLRLRTAEYFIPPWQARARSGETVKESGLPLPRERREASLTGS